MHSGSVLRMKWFVDNYVEKNESKVVLDVGSYNVNGCYRELFKDINVQYIGMDIDEGPNVDVVVKNPYQWEEIEDDSVDYIISGQALEHMEYPWEAMKQVYNKLKNGGICCIIAPNSIPEHKYPLDCFRYFDDGMVALSKYSGLQVIDVSTAAIPEIDSSPEWDHISNDVMLIAIKLNHKININDYKHMDYTRREDWYVLANNQCVMVKHWLKAFDRREGICDFFKINNIKRVVLKGNSIIRDEVKLDFQGIAEVVEWHNDIELDSDDLLILFDVDLMHNYIHYYSKIYSGSRVMYFSDFIFYINYLNYVKEHGKTLIYGAGVYGNKICGKLNEYNIEYQGVIVTNKENNEDVFDINDKIFMEKPGIVVAVSEKYKKAIFDILVKAKIDYVYYDDLCGITIID